MITIVDYQMGNLRSVQKALEAVGAEARVSDRPEDVFQAEKLILPGVGAFGDAMHELTDRGLAEPIRESIALKRPFLGICLGMQLLFDRSEESPEVLGLGVFSGWIRKLDVAPPLKVPHMGWNRVRVERACPVWEGLPEESFFYFVHSYVAVPTDPDLVALTCEYGVRFCAAICRENVFATQFHPEKSQSRGLQLLANFVKL